jgi:hypothetical protein
MSILTTVITEAQEIGGVPTIIFGVIALGIFAALGLVVWSFRDVAHRHEVKAQAYAAAHGGHDVHGQPGGGH